MCKSMIAKEYYRDEEILEKTLEYLRKGLKVALAVIISKRGSAPRGVGAKMIVLENGESIGSIGGGDLERIIIKEAKRALEEENPRVIKVSLFRDSEINDAIKTEKQLCGGIVTVYIDALKPIQRIIIIGAGHVARPLASIASMLGYRVIVIDNMPEYACKEKIPHAHEILVCREVIECLKKVGIGRNDRVVIAHGDAELEAKALEYILSLKEKPRYIGLLAGRGKLAYILKKLAEKSMLNEAVKHVYSPAGLAIGSETPEEIAVAIIAEILKVERKASGVHESIVSELASKVSG